MIIDQLFTQPVFEAADPNKLIVTVTILPMSAEDDTETKDFDLTGLFQGDARSQINQAMAYLKKFLESKGKNYTLFQATYQGQIVNQQNIGSMEPQNDAERELHTMANQMRAKRPAQNATPALKEFAPSDDGDGPDQEEMLRRMASYWWNGNEKQMFKVENTLAAMGWEIGQDDGYDDGGVFVVRAGDEHGRSYLSWPHEDLELNEVAPPGARAERMVRHIKQGYAKDGKLTPKEKGIAFATAWKAHNAGQLDEFARGDGPDRGNYLKELARAWYNMDFELLAHIARQGGNPLKNRMDVQETIENMLDRGIHCGDGRVRKYYIGYNSDFDGVEIQSHDHYEHSDTDDDGNDIDSRTGKPWGPYDVVEFSGDDLDESANPGMAEGRKKKNKKTSRSLGRYFFPGFGYYGSGESGEGGGDGGGGESANPSMAEAAQGHTIEAHGVRGMDRRTWHKTFRNTDQMIAWAEKHDAEIMGTRDLEQARRHNLSPARQDMAEGSKVKTAKGYGDVVQGTDVKTIAKADLGKNKLNLPKGYGDVVQPQKLKTIAKADDSEDTVSFREMVDVVDKHYPKYYAELSGSNISDKQFEQKITRAYKKIMQKQGVAEGSVNDYFKRRKDEEDRIAGTKAPAKRTPKQTDYEKKRKDQDITEMDKSEPSAGRDTGPRSGPDRYVKPITSKQMQDRAFEKLKQLMSKPEHMAILKRLKTKEDVAEADTLMLKLKRAMVKEGRVKELADDLKTMPDAEFMKKYGKAKAAIRKDMSRIDEKLSTSDTLSRPAAGASSSGKAIDDPDIMGSLRSGPKFDRLGKTGGEPELDFRAGLVGGETEVEADPRLMVDPLPDMQKWGGKFATGSAGGDSRFTAPTGWRYVEKGEDPARYGSDTTISGTGTPNWRELAADPKSAPPALDMTAKSKFKFDRATQSQVPTYGSGANPNIDAATRDRARAWAAQQNAPGAALAGAMRSSGTPVATAKNKTDWKTIYNLNKAIIGSDPNRIRPGMKLKMPNGSTYAVQSGDTLSKIAAGQINELSTNKLAQYKTAAAKDAKQADQEGDFKRGDKRFHGMVQATKKQFDNDAKKVDESRAARRALMAQIAKGN